MLALTNKLGKGYAYVSSLLSTGIFCLIVLVLVASSYKAWWNYLPQLFDVHWNPANEQFGILPMLVGTLIVTLIAMVIAVPIGLGTAVFLSEILPVKYRLLVKSILEILAGLPSILYGLIGVAFLSIWVQDWFDLQTGRTILTAGLLLAIMVLPTIITLSDDVFQQIPWQYRENARGLGLLKNEEVFHVLFPIAKPGLMGAFLLGLGRAMGETMAVMLVIGSIDKIPSPIMNWLVPGQTITSKLGREIAESSYGSPQFAALIFMGFVLMLMVLCITYLAQKLLKNE